MRELQGSVMDGFARRLPGTLNDMAEGAAPLDNAIRAIATSSSCGFLVDHRSIRYWTSAACGAR